jgi:hypothetical protein
MTSTASALFDRLGLALSEMSPKSGGIERTLRHVAFGPLPDITVAVLPAADIPAGGERAPRATGLDQIHSPGRKSLGTLLLHSRPLSMGREPFAAGTSRRRWLS